MNLVFVHTTVWNLSWHNVRVEHCDWQTLKVWGSNTHFEQYDRGWQSTVQYIHTLKVACMSIDEDTCITVWYCTCIIQCAVVLYSTECTVLWKCHAVLFLLLAIFYEMVQASEHRWYCTVSSGYYLAFIRAEIHVMDLFVAFKLQSQNRW